MTVVGITLDLGAAADGDPQVEQETAYYRAVEAAGGAPFYIPPLHNIAALRALYERIDALCIPGGRDVDPSRYGHEQHEKTRLTHADVEATEIQLLQWALADDMPILAICRGMQLLNVVMGGTLWQDIPSEVDTTIAHKVGVHTIAHDVDVVPDTKLAHATGSTCIAVTTSHHQAVKEVGPGLTVTATAPDGIVEGVESPDKRYVVAVQFHPENLVDAHSWAHNLFEGLVAAAEAKA